MSKKIFIIVFISFSLIFLFFSCLKPKEPLKIGLFVTLTGIYPDLGREIRDGALLAVEMINEEGGIRGRPLQLIIKDNQYNSETAKRNIEELLNEDVIALIGPATSTTAKIILPLINEYKILTIAPTPTSTKLKGLDDYMLRLRPTNREDAGILAEYLNKNLKIKSIVVIYDVINLDYTLDFIENLKNFLEKKTKLLIFSLENNMENFREFSRKILSQNPDAVLIITDVYNTSLLIQNFKILKPDLRIFITPWSKSSVLLQYSGKWAEGILTIDSIDTLSGGDHFKYVSKRFFERFGKDMNVGSIKGFDAVMVLKKALERGAERFDLKENILEIKRFEGLLKEIEFDEFGDNNETSFVLEVINGKFKRVTNEN